MDDELAGKIESIIRDYGDADVAADEIVHELDDMLYQAGWMPPDKTDRIFGRIREWMERTAKLPQDPGPGVLTSHLTELADIISDRQAHT